MKHQPAQGTVLWLERFSVIWLWALLSCRIYFSQNQDLRRYPHTSLSKAPETTYIFHTLLFRFTLLSTSVSAGNHHDYSLLPISLPAICQHP